MTPETCAAILNSSVKIAQEIAALPVQDEFSLHRLEVAVMAATAATREMNAARDARKLIERVKELG